MPNARRLRLHQVARELKVGQTTIIEFLEKKGVKVENSPSSIIEPAVYAILDKEFGGNKNIEKVNIREKIALKHEAVSLGTRKGSDGASEEESGFKSEVFVKSGVISVKDEVAAMSTPKILGKIDLSGGRSGRSSSSEKKPESPKKPAAASEASAPSAPAADAKRPSCRSNRSVDGRRCPRQPAPFASARAAGDGSGRGAEPDL